MYKLAVSPDRAVLRIGDGIRVDLRDPEQLRATLETPLFVRRDEWPDSYRFVPGLQFLGMDHELFVTAASPPRAAVSFKDHQDPDHVLSLPQVKRFMRRHPSLPFTDKGRAWVEFECPETSWQQLGFSHDRKNGHTFFLLQS